MLYPFILGILTKLYDDSVDINQFPESTPYLQSLIILFFALSAQNQFFFVVPCILVTALNNGFDNPFWKSMFPVSILLSIIYFPLGERMILLKIALSILAVFVVLALAYLEELYFPEEVSKRKIIFRSVLSAVLIAMLALFPTVAPFLLPRFSIEPIQIATYIQLGFILTSVITMSYLMIQGETISYQSTTSRLDGTPPTKSTYRVHYPSPPPQT
jgi:hypothetical protein